MSMIWPGVSILSFIRSSIFVPPAIKRDPLTEPALIAAWFVCGRNSLKGSILHLLDRGQDILVGSATANVTAHLLPDFSIGSGMALFDQTNRRTDLTGRAIAALKTIVF